MTLACLASWRWILLGTAVASCAADDRTPPPHEFPPGGYQRLSDTGFFTADLIPFEVATVLWSDGAAKERWLRVPDGAQIDTGDMDHWTLPVGAQLWKSFSRDGVLVETRLIERIAATGDRDDDFWVGAFVWSADGRDADFAPDGAEDAGGTDHDVPDPRACWDCHRGQPGAVLGLGALQLSHDGGAGLARLADAGLLSSPPDGPFAPPGEGAVQAALGYLHANCGHCHNPRGSARIDTDMDLQLSVSDATPADTMTYRSTVGVELQYWMEDGFALRVAPGEPDASGLLHRMSVRDTQAGMPPIATELVDEDGVALVRAWIAELE